MKLFVQNELRPGQVLFAFDDVVQNDVQRIRWAVAYTTQRGCRRLISRITSRIGIRQWERADKTFVTSLDYGLTEPAALRFLLALPGSSVLVSNPDVIARPRFAPRNAYHPKVYLFENARQTGFVVGSANLTDSALLRNTEVVTAGFEVPENGPWADAWTTLALGATPITDGLLTDYERRWRRPRPRIVEPEPTPPPPETRPADRLIFWDAITTGGIVPLNFSHLWVEAGSMSSGGSQNQLELPRGANVFLGFHFRDYGSAHRVIGHPRITLRGRAWTDRPLTWHGHNRMERINLPTRAQGGFDYRNSAIVFRRHEDGFELATAPWNDAEAIAWRAASDTLHTVFRLGERGNRVCGLF